ncbi:fumarylacetoacetase [Pseudochryseolinea flava]|uniref:fumarylacetoacetase n=1 Tax=Pseudochryseolinea flava TaxID=2059302 RepID=A0A364XWP7_9BACT|nr:fumarylacetoacetase [Pseudochryseolinea flava]RAV98799.1 fumarylacetoacetase [Pseudochryseolinea flava]
MLSSNDPNRKSWVEVPPLSDFPIQNLPFGIFKTSNRSPVAGVAIGEYVVDLAHLQDHGFLDSVDLPNKVFHQKYLNDFLSLGRKKIREVRECLSNLLKAENHILRDHASRKIALVPMHDVEMIMPVRIGNYTDFYSSEEHATNVGSMFRDPKNALLPNWKHLPVGYHGRASSIVVTGTPVRRPKGQIKPPDVASPIFSPSRKLDFELEVAFITCGENALGDRVTTEGAEDMIAGLVLFNDWSARDIQQWEYVPLGPFLSKNFASTISPWIVTLDALEPFRVEGPTQDPPVLPYLTFTGIRNFDIHLEVFVLPKAGKETSISKSNFKYMYWNMAQQLAHHTVNGCNIQVGDLYASGTISGPTPGSYGSLLELSWNGEKPLTLSDGTSRTFLHDNDTLIIRGHAEKNGVRIGFGSCSGKVLASHE